MPANDLPPDVEEFDLATTALEAGTTLIEASAGTGKTFTLAGLYLRLLVERGLTVEQILVVTYTVAATGELRERIRSVLAAAHRAFAHPAHPPAADQPPYLAALVRQHAAQAAALQRALATALSAFDQAAIHTIHGFCQRALRDRAFESASLFDVELVTDLADLQAQAAEDFWRRHVLTAGAIPLVLTVGEFPTPAELLEALRDPLKHPQLTPLPTTCPSLAETAATLRTAHAALAAEWRANAGEIRSLFGSGIKWGNNPYKSDDKMRAAFAAVEAALTQPHPAPGALSQLRLFTTEALTEKRAKRHHGPWPEARFFLLCDAFQAAAEQWLLSLRLAALRALHDELPQLKARLKVQSFDDLLTRLDAALHGPAGEPLARALRDQYHAALIDEFQDTDPLQFRIFQRVFQSPAADGLRPVLFLIGDPKQAIYGFRGADVYTYLHAQRTAERRYTLRQNFRTEARLVAGVNQVFARNPAAFVTDGIRFLPARAAGHTDRQPFTLAGQRPPPLQIWLYPRGEKVIPATHAQRTLPAGLASEIVRLLHAGARLGDRPLQPGDIAILIPANHQALDLQQALGERGVPTVLQTTASLFTAPEVAEMQRLLAALQQPGDERLLRAALATTALGRDAAALQALAHNDAAWQALADDFTDLAHVWSRKGLLPMFRALLQREQVRTRLLALPDGERRLTNLLHLAEVLHQAAREHNLSRDGLLNWLAEQAADPDGAGDAFQLRLERDERAVRLVTIHRSKGLEYGLVYCPYSWKGVLRPHRVVAPLFHRTAADGQPELCFDFGSPELEPHRALAQEEDLAQQVRTLYVALTRAKHRCTFVWGQFNGAATAAAAWLLHPPPAPNPNPPLAQLTAHWPELTAELFRADLDQLAHDPAESVEIVPVPTPTDDRYQPPAETARPTHARIFTATPERAWRLSSFSSLTAARHSETPDYDAHPAPPTATHPASGIFAFPRGARAGTCLHKLFEQLDFTRATEPAARELLHRTLREHAIPTSWAADLEQMLAEVLHAPLPGAPLVTIGPAQRLNELEFCFPIGRLDSVRLNAFFARQDPDHDAPARFAFDPVTGLLKGFLDLIYTVGGRFYIVDWKSNWLGNHPSDYAPAALQAEIRRRHYDLQYRLYTVALDKYLRTRLPDYHYETHFGGVCYVFLRGVAAAHRGCGLFHDRPSADFVQEFSALLAAG